MLLVSKSIAPFVINKKYCKVKKAIQLSCSPPSHLQRGVRQFDGVWDCYVPLRGLGGEGEVTKSVRVRKRSQGGKRVKLNSFIKVAQLKETDKPLSPFKKTNKTQALVNKVKRKPKRKSSSLAANTDMQLTS